MTIIKSYTDIEQSKKLAEILPLESADMHYWWHCLKLGVGHSKELQEGFESRKIEYTPCWSLTALLDVLPYAIHKSDNEFYRLEIDKGYNDYAVWYSNNGITINDLDVISDNFIDACYEMILKLHEQNLL